MSRRLGVLLLLAVLAFSMQNIVVTYSEVSFIGSSIEYRAENMGVIRFDMSFTASRLYFTDGFIMTKGFSNGWPLVGFQCETSTTNMTIKKVAAKTIGYVIDGPMWTESKSKVYTGSKGKPSSVTGCDGWTYDGASKVATITVTIVSPKEVTLKFSETPDSETNGLKEWVYEEGIPSIRLIAAVPILMAVALILSALTGKLDMNIAMSLLITILLISVLVWVLTEIAGG